MFRRASHSIEAPFPPIPNAPGASQEINSPPKSSPVGHEDITAGKNCGMAQGRTGSGNLQQGSHRAETQPGCRECSQFGTFWARNPHLTPQPSPPSSRLSPVAQRQMLRPGQQTPPDLISQQRSGDLPGTSTCLNKK